jgi:hypothetical protein
MPLSKGQAVHRILLLLYIGHPLEMPRVIPQFLFKVLQRHGPVVGIDHVAADAAMRASLSAYRTMVASCALPKSEMEKFA